MDKVTQQRILEAHPALREELQTICELIDQRLTGRAAMRLTQVLRTYKQQDALYAQGRTAPGPRVTNARGGYSYHNFGLAVDFCLIIDGKEVSWNMIKDYDSDKEADWLEVVHVFEAFGWEWGGRWKSFKDNPHFQKTFKRTEKEYRELVAAGQTVLPGSTYPELSKKIFSRSV